MGLQHSFDNGLYLLTINTHKVTNYQLYKFSQTVFVEKSNKKIKKKKHFEMK